MSPVAWVIHMSTGFIESGRRVGAGVGARRPMGIQDSLGAVGHMSKDMRFKLPTGAHWDMGGKAGGSGTMVMGWGFGSVRLTADRPAKGSRPWRHTRFAKKGVVSIMPGCPSPATFLSLERQRTKAAVPLPDTRTVCDSLLRLDLRRCAPTRACP